MKTPAMTGLIAAAMFSCHAASAANLVKDGGFEKPATPAGSYTLYNTGDKIGSWTVVGAQGNVNTVSTTFMQNGFTFDAKAGKAYIDLTGTSNSATGVSQSVKTVPGMTYQLTFWVGNVYNPGGIFGTASTVNVYAGSSLLVAATNSKGNGSTKQVWQKFTTSFTATSSRVKLSFINGDPSGDSDCGLDAISLLAVPK